ncbi:uncharacterized protein LOC117330542 [Pecten maximus]|uniref:uncharacterized protein LOC117330542 n=1 Tax=Pecten maximus TaxID=6579 RepID=UPI001458320C|nr:uncharacterized protein LOC117330542 [Pecten maximus]
MSRGRVVYQIIVFTTLVSLTTGSDTCEDISVGSQKECLPTWSRCETEQDRYRYEPPLNCTALYNDKLSRCFHSANPVQDVSSGTTLPVSLVTGVFLSSKKELGQSKPLLNIAISQPTISGNGVLQLRFRSSRAVSDEYYVDPYYEKFPAWRHITFPVADYKELGKKSFRVTYGHLDTCNVRCEWGKCTVYPNLYLLTMTLFSSSEKQSLPGQSITYQVTSHNRRVLPNAKDTHWKPNVMTAVLPDQQGVHVVFEPLPNRYVDEHTYYKVSLQDWETWEVKQNKTVIHNKEGAFYGCTFDNNEPEGIYEVLVQYKNCKNCPFQTWVKSADFSLPEYSIPIESRTPKISIESEPRYTVAVILGTLVTLVFVTVNAFFCRRIIKARQQRNRRLSAEKLFQNNNNEIAVQTDDPSRELQQLSASTDSIPTKLQKLSYPNDYIDEPIIFKT